MLFNTYLVLLGYVDPNISYPSVYIKTVDDVLTEISPDLTYYLYPSPLGNLCLVAGVQSECRDRNGTRRCTGMDRNCCFIP